MMQQTQKLNAAQTTSLMSEVRSSDNCDGKLKVKYINSFFDMLEFKQLRSTILIRRLLVEIPPISSSPSIEWLENQLSGWKSNLHP